MLLTRRNMLAVTLAAFTAVAPAAARTNAGDDIVDTAVAAGKFKTLAAALGAADLAGALKGKGPFTVFAPTDAAFARLPDGTVASLLKPESKSTLQKILTYHVVPGAVMAGQVVKLPNATTLNGQRVRISVNDGVVSVGGAKVVATDIKCSNGVIHIIDSVMMPASDNIPATAAKAGTFKTLLAAAQAAGLVDALSGDAPLTVFAPTDDAFNRLPKGTVASLLKPENVEQLKSILLYHVVKGRVYSDQALKLTKAETLNGSSIRISSRKAGAFINDSKLTAVDIETSNGVIHVIDHVLLPSKKQKVTQNDSCRVIEHTIDRGAHLYNSGHVDACASLYMKSVSELLDGNHAMPHAAQSHLRMAMSRAKATHCTTTQSWALRRGLDGAYRTMTVSMSR
jgi:uncharacterized surface protein with fasciclin (FAS1) repeats